MDSSRLFAAVSAALGLTGARSLTRAMICCRACTAWRAKG